MKKILPLLIFLLTIPRPWTVAQWDRYQFSRLNIDNGLSNNRVICIYKDKKGFMWFGTKSGLNRYDGYMFKVFKHDINNPNSINDDYINSITEGPENKLWVKTRKGFSIYNPMTNVFENHIKRTLKKFGVPDSLITSVKEDSLGNFWLLHSKNGLYQYQSTKNISLHLSHSDADTTSPHKGIGTDFASDSKGNLWVVYSDGILEKLDPVTHKIVSRIYSLNKAYPEENIDYRLSVDRQNEVWVYAPFRANGLFFVSNSKKFTRLGKTSGDIKISSDIVFNVVQDDKGLIWIGTDHGGVNLLNKNPFRVVQTISNRPDDNRSLSQNCIISLFKDNHNIIWLGTFKKGISYYHQDLFKFPLYRHQSFEKKGLTYDDINRFIEDKKGNIWIGSNGGGLIYFNRNTGSFKTYLHNDANSNSLSNNVIASMYLDHEQKLWIGTYFGGLDCFDGNYFTHYKHSQTDSTSLSDNSIWEILEDSKNRLWIGTLSGGLNLFDRNRRNFIHYPSNRPNSIPNAYISGLLEDHQGNLWIATYGGLAVLLNGTNRFIYYKHNESDIKSLCNDNVSNLILDSRNLIWVATNEGLSMFDPKTSKFKNFRQANGLPDNGVLNLVEDKDHTLWISTLNGLSNLLITTSKNGDYRFEFKNYDQTDGLQGKDFNEDAALRTRSGELIFGGANGFNLFKPDIIKSAQEKPVLVLTDFQLFNKSIQAGQKVDGEAILNQTITETHEITLHHNQNVFSIEFAAINFFNPAKIKHSYILEGFDKNWILADNRIRKASYTNLDPGTYYFNLRAAGEDGHWGNKPLTLKITVLPPIWQTPWAYFLYLLIAVATLFFIRHRGIKKLKNNFAAQQELQKVQQMHELDLRNIKFYTNISHECRTPLSLILAPLEKLLNQNRDGEINKQLQMIHRNAKRLLNLINHLLDFGKIEDQDLKLHTEKSNLVKFIEETVCSFSDIAENKNISLRFESNIEFLNIPFDHDKIERILFNLLSNAFKFTHNGGSVRVLVSLIDLTEINKELKIEIRDNGIGIPPEKLDKIFDRFFQNDLPSYLINRGNGIGLAITKEFVELHLGTIRVESKVNMGSNFIISFPVNLESSMEDKETTIHTNLLFYDSKNLEQESLEIDNGIPTPSIQPPKSFKKSLILLIEDNEDFRSYLKDHLITYYRILEAVNGVDGWNKALSMHPDLIVSDINMPKMNGINLCQKIKNDSRTQHIPFILLTASPGQNEELKGLETGAFDYLIKPFNFQILLSKIKNQLNQQKSLKKTYQKQINLDTAIHPTDFNRDKFMMDMMKNIEKNIDNPVFSVEELSSSLAINRVTLYRKTLMMTERTPVEFIKWVRLKKAAQLLENSHFNIAEIAYKVGFNNPKYFAKAFKQEFNVLPTDYRCQTKPKEEALLEK